MIPVVDETQRRHIEAMRDLILAEVNVKELKYVDNAAGILVKRVKPDFKKLGPRYGKIMKQLAAIIAQMSQEDILAFEKEGRFTFNVEGVEATIETTDVEILSEDIPGWLVANEGRITVALDITITDALRREGVAREIVKKIQAVRKESGFDITDRISVVISSNETSDKAVEEFKEYICNQVLADKLVIGEVENGEDVELDGYTIKVSVERI
jgi:isoleucyl-tRNA synthetase